MSNPSPHATMTGEGPLALLCGGGSLPFAVAEAVRGRGRDVVLFPFKGWVDPKAVESYPHRWVSIGQFGQFCRMAQREGCRDLVMIGSLVRPAIWQIRLDFLTLRLLPRIIRAFRGGDDHLLSRIGQIFEDLGFRLLGAHEVAPEILIAAGVAGRCSPNERDNDDIKRGFEVLAAIGPYDVGQAVVVANNHVLALEAAEGTDQMLIRIAELRQQGRVRSPLGTGVLVKAPKPGQDLRFDLPSIGPATITGISRAGLAGVAVLSGATVVAEPQRVVVEADRAGVFVTASDYTGPCR